ncbi:MAG: hypothetical protein ABI851_09030 [Saprospiraceae bacterium]
MNNQIRDFNSHERNFDMELINQIRDLNSHEHRLEPKAQQRVEKAISIFKENTGTEVKGGTEFYKDDGHGKETKFSEDAEIGENIDNFESTFGIAVAAAGASLPATMFDGFKHAMDAIQVGHELLKLYEENVDPKRILYDTFNDLGYKINGNDTIVARDVQHLDGLIEHLEPNEQKKTKK